MHRESPWPPLTVRLTSPPPHPRRSVPAMAAGPGGMGGGVGYCRVSGGGCLLVLAGDAHRVPARVPPVLLLVPVLAPSGPP